MATRSPALAIFGLLLTVYLLTFSGRFTSIDELALYAQTESWAQQGNAATPQLAFAPYHNPVGRLEPGFPLLAVPLYWLAQPFEALNNIQAVMLLNPLLVALTAAVLYHSGRAAGFSSVAATLAALSYGLGTLAWPYALFHYREPLVGLLWMVGLYGAWHWHTAGHKGWLLGGVAAVLAALAVKISAVVWLPCYLLLLLWPKTLAQQRGRQLIVALAVAGGLALAFPLLWRWRYGDPLDLLGRLDDVTPALVALRVYGQLLSPAKGLLFYMPSAALAIAGLIPLWRRSPLLAGLALGPLAALVVTYSGYNAWYGGQSWGVRFLVPALPLLMLGVAAVWDDTRHTWGRPLILLLVAISVVWQLPAATNRWWFAYEPLYLQDPAPEKNLALLSDVALAPPLQAWRVWRLDRATPLWLQTDENGQRHFQPLLAAVLAGSLVAVLGVWWLGRPASALWPALLALGALLWWGGRVPIGYAGLSAAQAQAIAQWVRPPDPADPYTLVTVSNEFHTYFALGYYKGDFVHHWYSPQQLTDFEPLLAQREGQWVALAVDRVHISPEVSGKELEWWLNEQLFRGESEWVGEYELVRYAHLTAAEWQTLDPAVTFGDSFRLRRFALSQRTAAPGDTLGVQLELCHAGALPTYHQLFAHLVAPTNSINGHDGPLRYGAVAHMDWAAGDCLIERRAFYIPPQAAEQSYALVVGFNTPEGHLLAEGEPYLTLDTVEIKK